MWPTEALERTGFNVVHRIGLRVTRAALRLQPSRAGRRWTRRSGHLATMKVAIGPYAARASSTTLAAAACTVGPEPVPTMTRPPDSSARSATSGAVRHLSDYTTRWARSTDVRVVCGSLEPRTETRGTAAHGRALAEGVGDQGLGQGVQRPSMRCAPTQGPGEPAHGGVRDDGHGWMVFRYRDGRYIAVFGLAWVMREQSRGSGLSRGREAGRASWTRRTRGVEVCGLMEAPRAHHAGGQKGAVVGPGARSPPVVLGRARSVLSDAGEGGGRTILSDARQHHSARSG